MRFEIKGDSKEDEIKFIEKLHERFKDKDLYLSGLFTKDFVVWVTNKIRDDIYPDMYEWLK